MTAVEQIITEKIPHGDIWIGFTPDEEVGAVLIYLTLTILKPDLPTPLTATTRRSCL